MITSEIYKTYDELISKYHMRGSNCAFKIISTVRLIKSDQDVLEKIADAMLYKYPEDIRLTVVTALGHQRFTRNKSIDKCKAEFNNYMKIECKCQPGMRIDAIKPKSQYVLNPSIPDDSVGNFPPEKN